MYEVVFAFIFNFDLREEKDQDRLEEREKNTNVLADQLSCWRIPIMVVSTTNRREISRPF